MKNILVILLLVLVSTKVSFAQFSENFSDGDFTNNPTWIGSSSLFTITAGQLNSQSPTAANYYLGTSSTLAANAEFIFDINLKFATSGSNYADVYLMSDKDTLTNPGNGYFVRVGSTQDDIKLYKMVAGVETILVDGADASVNSSTNNPFRIRVTRDASNLWTLYYDDGILGSYLNAGSIVDNSVNSSSYFGVKIIQSSAAGPINNHFFDNFYVGALGADTQAPTIDSVVVTSATNLDVYYNETVEINSAQSLSNYSADNTIGNPTSAIRDAIDSSKVHLTFAATFGNGVLNTLTVNNVEDLSTNSMVNVTKTFTYIIIIVPNYRDVVINEIFADPTPQVGLPTFEFVELYNPSSNIYNLSGWKFVNTTTSKTLPNFVLAPNSYVILCNTTDTALFSSYGNVIGIASFVALTNGGDSLTLMDNNNNLLDVVSYDISWYQDNVKSAGGWTLEQINPSHPCGGSLNWISSIDATGGTPDAQNSVYNNAPDLTAPQINSVGVNSLSQLTVNFSETMDYTSLTNATITISNGINVTSVVFQSLPNSIVINVTPNLDSLTIYTIQIINSTDCSGNALNPNSMIFDINADNQAPTIDSVVVVNANNLDVYFNETVEINSSQNLSNYVVDNSIGNPTSAIRDVTDSSLVHLTFATAFGNNVPNILTVNNIQDLSANAMVNVNKPFTYLVFVVPNYRDVVINEIFADPTPQVGLPNAEFVELYNNSINTYNLLGWNFINSTTSKTLPNFSLAPNAYVILCNSTDTALFSPFGNVIGISSFSALTNGGDSLTLMDNNSNLLDAVAYDISWYQDVVKADGGWTLELINPSHPCSGSLNWIASSSVDGGTPDAQNSVFSVAPDLIDPQISSVVVNSVSQLTINFNETMDYNSLVNAAITISGGITVSSVIVQSFPNKMIVNVTPNLDSATVYTIQILNATDCSGNTLNPATATFGIGSTPLAFEIVINEIFADPDPSIGLPVFEYIELFNTTTKVLNLSTLKVADPLTTSGFLSGTLFPNEYIIICSSTTISQFTPYGKVIGVSSFPSLNNASDEIKLINAGGDIIHQVNYFDTWYQDLAKKDGGWSLEMIDPNNPCGEANNWSASTKWFGGTPGTQNSIFGSNPDNSAPKLINGFALNDSTIQITFDENTFLGAVNVDHGIIINSILAVDGKTYNLILSNKLTFQTTYTVVVNGSSDCIGNIGNSSISFSLPEQGNSGDIVINEVLFNPFTGGSDFVEIYNNSNKYINLQNWYLANFDNDSISNKKLIISQPYVLFPGNFTVFTKDANNIKQEYINAKQDRMLEMATLPTYNNTDGNVYLINNLNETVDHFTYNEKMHFALLNDFKGVSLERIDYNRPTSDNTNWHSAAEDAGYATPGYENSQFQQVDAVDGISISPETFSPDNDGIDDVVNISYQFSEAGYVGNIIIYDAKGRLIKNLILNELLGAKGTFSWDGINENNEKSGIGIYIIYFEVFNLKGDVSKYKKTCVLGGYFK